ncbi:MAG: M48 family metallopeptidase [Coriobacteriales bacterium]|jgi:predicted metal-dependent hydrolase
MARAASRIEAAGFEVTVTRRKNMKNVRLHVHPDGSVSISCPYGVPTSELTSLLEARADWIQEQRKRLAGTPRAQAETASEQEQEEWRVLVTAAVPLLLKKWEPVLGVRAKKLAFRNMKSRWGSCQPTTGRVCINTRLALYPPRCLEYVVVHELCHMLVPNHGPRFKALLDEYLPKWREAEKLLRN